MKECKMENCSKSIKGGGHGLCPMHYRRYRLYGDPNIVKQHKYYGLTMTERFFKYVNKTDGCWLWTGKKHRQGYGEMWVKGKPMLTHRISWLIHHGFLPLTGMVLHHCDNPPCVNPEHLYLGDHRQNMDDMMTRDRSNPPHLFGEANPGAKITADIVREIRRSKEPPRYFVEKYGITRSNVWYIRTYKSWQHVK